MEGGKDALDKMDLDDGDDTDAKGMQAGEGDDVEGGERKITMKGLPAVCDKHQHWLRELDELFVPGGGEKIDSEGHPKVLPIRSRRQYSNRMVPGSGVRQAPISRIPTKGGTEGKPDRFKALVYLDMSGSVNEYKNSFADAMACMLKYVTDTIKADLDITFCTVTTQITDEVLLSSDLSFEQNANLIKRMSGRSGGGIDIVPCVHHAVTRPEYDTAVMISDGGYGDSVESIDPDILEKFSKQMKRIGFVQIGVAPDESHSVQGYEYGWHVFNTLQEALRKLTKSIKFKPIHIGRTKPQIGRRDI